MNIADAIILGLVEGFSEFLPISSTAHLIITSKLLTLRQVEFISFFEVFIQSGAILAVIALYWRLIRDNPKHLLKIAISFVPTAIVGFAMHDLIKDVFFNSTTIIGLSLILISFVFLLTELLIAKRLLVLKRDIEKMSHAEAFAIGFIQALAVVPGVSRAGAVIIGMMLMRYKRSQAATYSFLLAVPTILAASALDLIKTDPSLLTTYNITLLIVGFITSFVSALIFVKWLVAYLQKNTLILFAIYRILIGLAVLFYLA